jgi:hypothetical protein
MLKQLGVGIAVSVMATGAAMAGPLEDGQVAYARGHYLDALRLWKPIIDYIIIVSTAFAISFLVSRNKRGVSWAMVSYSLGVTAAVVVAVAFALMVLSYQHITGSLVENARDSFLLWERGIMTSILVAPLGILLGVTNRTNVQQGH